MKLDFTKPLQLKDGTPVKHVYSGNTSDKRRHRVVIDPGITDKECSEWIDDSGAGAFGFVGIINVPERSERFALVTKGGHGSLLFCTHDRANLRLIFEGDKLVSVEVLK